MAFKSVYRGTDSLLKKAEGAGEMKAGEGAPFGPLPKTAFGTRHRIARVEKAMELQKSIISTLREYQTHSKVKEKKEEERDQLAREISDNRFTLHYVLPNIPPERQAIKPAGLQKAIRRDAEQRSRLKQEIGILNKYGKFLEGPGGEGIIDYAGMDRLIAREEKNLAALVDYRKTLVEHLKILTGFHGYALTV